MSVAAGDFDAEADLEILAELVGDVGDFASEVWGKRPLLRPAAVDWGSLLTTDDIEHLLLTGARLPTFRLVRDGETLPERASTRPVRLGGRHVADAADVERIGSAMADGATLVMQGLQRTWMPVTRLCRSLERATSHAVQANAYLTPPGATGLRPHQDEHDVIIVQLEGRKQWEIDGLGDIALAAGDVLYLPAGTQHSASAQADLSLHLTIGILTTTFRAVVGRMLQHLGGVADAPLPLGYARASEARLRVTLEEAVESLRRDLGGVDFGAVARSEIERARSRRRPVFTGHLRSAVASLHLDLGTKVRARDDLFVELVADGAARIALRLPDRTVSLPAVGEPAVRQLLGGGAISVGALSGIDDESKVVVARRLVKEGVLEVLETGR